MGTRQIQVSGALWQQVCTVGWRGTFECIEGLPEGAEFCGASYKHHSIQGEALVIVIFLFEHPDWPEIELGENGTRVLEIVWEKIADA